MGRTYHDVIIAPAPASSHPSVQIVECLGETFLLSEHTLKRESSVLVLAVAAAGVK